MEKYYKRALSELSPPVAESERLKQSRGEFNFSNLPHDPGLRKKMADYHPDLKDQVRREYLQRGPCQPKEHDFVQTQMGQISRSSAKGGGDCFSDVGYRNFKKKDKLRDHEGKHNSFHNQARQKCDILMNENQHLRNIVKPFVEHSRVDYRVRLGASVDCIRFLLRQGLAFRGHDESENSSNKGNFLELLQFLVDHNDEVRDVALKLAPENHKLTSPDIQKDIVNAVATETTNAILQNMGDTFFSILVDESRDVSMKEQMAVIFRYVDKVIFFLYDDMNDDVHISIYSSETKTCRKLDYIFENQDMFTKVAFYNGALFWSDYLLETSSYFDITQESIENVLLTPQHSGPSSRDIKKYFGGDGRNLHLILGDKRDHVINVYELKKDYSSWIVKYTVDFDTIVDQYFRGGKNSEEIPCDSHLDQFLCFLENEEEIPHDSNLWQVSWVLENEEERLRILENEEVRPRNSNFYQVLCVLEKEEEVSIVLRVNNDLLLSYNCVDKTTKKLCDIPSHPDDDEMDGLYTAFHCIESLSNV